jgi:hypothetical protein
VFLSLYLTKLSNWTGCLMTNSKERVSSTCDCDHLMCTTLEFSRMGKRKSWGQWSKPHVYIEVGLPKQCYGVCNIFRPVGPLSSASKLSDKREHQNFAIIPRKGNNEAHIKSRQICKSVITAMYHTSSEKTTAFSGCRRFLLMDALRPCEIT